MDYALGWGTLALLNAAIANVDGRSPLAYFVGSMFFGPVITLILAVTWEPAGHGLKQVDLLYGRPKRTAADRPDPSI